MTTLNWSTIDPGKPLLIAGPTASGKSALALEVAARQGGVIVNADALQVYDGWRLLTARPGPEDLAAAPHALYGHIPFEQPYSVGDWLADVAPLLKDTRPIIIGGTGLYFTALTEGLSPVPQTPPEVRAEGDAKSLEDMRAALDATTLAVIDQMNRARVQRAWEVQRATDRSLLDWQSEPTQPILPDAQGLLVNAPKEWLTPRIERRFDLMMDSGLMDEAASLLPRWAPNAPGAKAIGAAEVMAHLRGEISESELREAVTIQTRQYAKRQRTWFRSRMKSWSQIAAEPLS